MRSLSSWQLLTLTSIACFLSGEGCKQASPSQDLLSGSWFQGGAGDQSCRQIEEEPHRLYARTHMDLKARDDHYSYTVDHKVFDDPQCSEEIITSQYEGSFYVGEAVAGKKLPTRKIYHSQSNFSVRIVRQSALNFANLKTSEGYQGGLRLCGLNKDWQLLKTTDVSGKKCALGIQTQVLARAINVVKTAQNPLRFFLGKDYDADFTESYILLIEEELTPWYKNSQ